jgi:Tropinone reductase 1
LATVKSLLANDAAGVLFCSRRGCDELLLSLREEFPESKIVHVICDVATEDGRDTLYKAAKESFGGTIQGLVNNVGINIRKKILEQTPEEYNSMMKTNVDSAYFLCRLFSDLFEGGSTIVNVSSAAGVQSSGTGAVYGMSKAAINQFSKILACEWASRNIRVNAVTPWMTMTPMLIGENHTIDFCNLSLEINRFSYYRCGQEESLAIGQGQGMDTDASTGISRRNCGTDRISQHASEFLRHRPNPVC